MARRAARPAENAPGDFYVDSSCIDCDTCRQIAPEVFASSPRQAFSHVRAQPRTAEPRHRACMALVSCPAASIGTTTTPKPSLTAAIHALPEPVAGVDGVRYCGFASRIGAR